MRLRRTVAEGGRLRFDVLVEVARGRSFWDLPTVNVSLRRMASSR